MSRTHGVSRGISLIALLLVFVATPVSAWVGVGSAPTCEVRTVQAAVDEIMARERNGDFDDPFIAVAGGTFTQAVNIDSADIVGPGGARVTITGGYAADCSGPEQGASTKLEGSTHVRSVVTIHGQIAVTLVNMSILGANTSGNGGGIDFDGAGSLDLTGVQVHDNHAGRGGGLFANGVAPGLFIRVHHDTDFHNNLADHNGGGIRIQGQTRLSMLEGGHISNNKVPSNDSDGAGGGLQVVGPARADLGSVELSFNQAKYGGGVSVNSSGSNNGWLRFFTSLPGAPTVIESNEASNTGGGIFIGGGDNTGDSRARGIACGSGYKIDRNVAAEGSAIYTDTELDAGVLLLGPDRLQSPDCGDPVSQALKCPSGTTCNTIDENRAESNGTPTDGSAVLLQTYSTSEIQKVWFRGNRGRHVLRAFLPLGLPIGLYNVVITDNVVSDDLIRLEEGARLNLFSSTIADNVIGGSHVLSLGGNLKLGQSLIWQSGKIILDQDSSLQRNVHDVLANEIVSLGGGAGVEAIYPQFRDPANGDYHLAASSHALDYAAAVGGTDAEELPRSVELPLPNRPGGGPLDLGAYELQGIPVFPPDEKFDGVVAPVLPPLWTNDHTGAGVGWITMQGSQVSAPNVASTDDPPTVTDKSLTSPAIEIVKKGRLRFRYKIDLEQANDTFARDGIVLEIAIGTGEFKDIVLAGGSFVNGGYDHVIALGSPGDNPLKGRSVWSGIALIGAYRTVLVNLPDAADGQSVRVRWRMGTDNANASPHGGYLLDDIHIEADSTESLFCDSFDGGSGCA